MPFNFVQISPACGPFTYQIMYVETSDFGNGNMKRTIGKLIFAANLPLKLIHATMANDDNGRLKSLHTLFDTHLDHMLAKCVKC